MILDKPLIAVVSIWFVGMMLIIATSMADIVEFYDSKLVGAAWSLLLLIAIKLLPSSERSDG